MAFTRNKKGKKRGQLFLGWYMVLWLMAGAMMVNGFRAPFKI